MNYPEVKGKKKKRIKLKQKRKKASTPGKDQTPEVHQTVHPAVLIPGDYGMGLLGAPLRENPKSVWASLYYRQALLNSEMVTLR